jgi:predicted lipoprotein
MIWVRGLMLGSALMLCASASAQETSSAAIGADYAVVIRRAAEDYIVPAYQELETETGELSAALAAFCDGRSERDTVETAFAATLHAWAKVDFLRFGLMAQEGRYERFAFWPDVHGTGARQIRQFLASRDEKLLAPGALARQSAAVQGLPALESLLFSGEKSLLATNAPDAFRCRLAGAVADNLKAIAAEVVTAWTGESGWAELIGSPGPANPVYRSHGEAMTEILRGILTGLEQDRDHRLLPALGKEPQDAKASRAPYNRSGQALEYLLVSAQSLQAFVEASGILGLLPRDERLIGDSIRFEFGNLVRALENAGPDLESALRDTEGRGKLVYATIVLGSLRDLFQNQFAPAAGVTAGFNSLDGD